MRRGWRQGGSRRRRRKLSDDGGSWEHDMKTLSSNMMEIVEGGILNLGKFN